jgi:hypothetical protein
MTIFGYTLCAQDYLDLVQASYTNTPLNQFDTSLNKTRVQDVVFSSTLPIKLNDRTAIISGLDVEWMHSKLTPAGGDGSAMGLLLKAGVNHKLNDKWSTNFVVLPRLSSDFRGALNGNDFQLGGLWMFKYTKRENLKYKFAMYYNSELFGPFMTPIFGWYYKSPNQKYEMDFSLPLMADMNYRLHEKVVAGLRFQAFVRTYNLHTPFYSERGEYLAKTSNEIYTYAAYEPVKGLIFKANIGYSVARNYRLYHIDDQVSWGLSAFRFGDDRKQLNADFSDGLLFRIDCVFRLYLTENK